MELVTKRKLWFIEDCCDALGSTYNGKLVSTFGHVATFSFYPAHQITMGEGGAVVTSNPFIHKAIRQFRDWEEIVGATQAKIIPVANVSNGNWETYRTGTIINISIRKLDII